MLVLCHLSVMLSIMSQSSGENRETCRSVRQEKKEHNSVLYACSAPSLPFHLLLFVETDRTTFRGFFR